MADEITDAEIARFAGAVKEAEERDAAGHAGAVVATARFGRGLLARLERAEKAARIWYDGDGNPVELESAEAVTAGRIGAAKELARLLAIEAGGCAGCDSRDARIATLERELSRWRGCEQVEGDYVCKHEFECSQILRPRIATLEAALLPLAAHARSEAMRAAEGSERKRIMDKWATAAETALRGVEGKP